MNTKPRISRKLAAAIDEMLSGRHKTQKAAAHAAGMTDTQLCRAMKKPHVNEYLMAQAKRELKGFPLAMAVARMSQLINAGSEQVAFNAADKVMRVNGMGGEGERAVGSGGIALQIVFKHHAQAENGQPGVVIEASATDCKTPLQISVEKSAG